MEHPPQKTTSNLLYPLERFYIDTSLPHVEHCYPDTMPQSYKNLLVHTNDMTSTLANFHHEGISLQVLDLQNSADALYRKVLLIGDDERTARAFAACIDFEVTQPTIFPLESRRDGPPAWHEQQCFGRNKSTLAARRRQTTERCEVV